MENESLSSKVIEQIQEKHIQPTPKWEFALKNVVVWVVLGFLLVVGSLGSSVIIFMIDTNQWDLYDKVHHNIVAFVFASLPYFWLIILALFISAIYYYFHQTKSGYKYHAYAIVLASFLFSSFLGLIFYNAGFARTIDQLFEKRVPLYSNFTNPRQKVLARPEFGVLPGQIVQIVSPQELIIMDIKNKPWNVLLSSAVIECPCFIGNQIIALGEAEPNHTFNAYEIRELKPRLKRPQRIMQYFELRILQPQTR
jgi:hypothetical protein